MSDPIVVPNASSSVTVTSAMPGSPVSMVPSPSRSANTWPPTQAAPEPLPGSRSPKSWFVRPVIGTVSGPNSSGVVDVYPAGWISRTRYEPGAMPVKA